MEKQLSRLGDSRIPCDGSERQSGKWQSRQYSDKIQGLYDWIGCFLEINNRLRHPEPVIFSDSQWFGCSRPSGKRHYINDHVTDHMAAPCRQVKVFLATFSQPHYFESFEYCLLYPTNYNSTVLFYLTRQKYGERKTPPTHSRKRNGLLRFSFHTKPNQIERRPWLQLRGL